MNNIFSTRYSWRRLTYVLSVLSVVAFSKFLGLDKEIVMALIPILTLAGQAFFAQHKDEGQTPPTAAAPAVGAPNTDEH